MAANIFQELRAAAALLARRRRLLAKLRAERDRLDREILGLEAQLEAIARIERQELERLSPGKHAPRS